MSKGFVGVIAARALPVVACLALLHGHPVGGSARVSAIPARQEQASGAPAQQPLRPLAVTQLDQGRQPGDLDSARAVSLRFAEPLPIRDLLLLLFRDTPFSLALDPDVEGVFIGELRDLTLREALELALFPLDLDYSVENNSIRVFRRRLETRLIDINYVLTRRAARRQLGAITAPRARADQAGATRSGETSPVAGASQVDLVASEDAGLFDELSTGIATLLSGRGKFFLDRKAALLQVTDLPDTLDKVALYLQTVEARVQRQVEIRAQVVEVELRDEYARGLDWGAIQRHLGGPLGSRPSAGTASSGLAVGVGRGPATLLDALAQQGRVNVLSSPRVVAMNNEPAVMRAGTQDVYFVTATVVDESLSDTPRQTAVVPQTITEGVILSVTPQIGQDGIIQLSVSPRITARTGEATSPSGDVVPVLSVRETDTLVRVYDGETVVITGLLQDRLTTTRERVPVVGSIPLFGRLFRRDRTSQAKTDLVILLTPTIVTPGRLGVPSMQE